MKPIKKAVHLFIKNCGGIDKIQQAIASLQAMKRTADNEQTEKAYTDFMLRLSKNSGGAKQLVAAALMGFTLSALTFDAVEDAAERN